MKLPVVVALGLLLGGAMEGNAGEHLNVTFDEGYAEGEVDGQISSQGGTGGAWSVTGALYVVEPAPDGRKALRISRHGTAQAHVPLITPLPTQQKNIYIAFDALRANERSRAYWVPLAAPGSTPMGAGLCVLGDGRVELITGWKLERLPTEFFMVPGKWHRFELEIDGPGRTMDAFVTIEGNEQRVVLARQVPWETKNQTVRYFRLAQPDGGPESVVYTDRLVIQSDVTFPFQPQ